MSQVVEVNSLDELAGYRLLWNALLPQTPGASFFQSLDWLEVYWRHFGGDQRLRVLIVHSDGRPIGILPLTVAPQKTRLGMVRSLTYPLNDWGAFYGPIGPNPTATLTVGMRHIRQTARDWDIIDLRWVNTCGWDHGRTARAMRFAGLKPDETVWAETAQVDTSGRREDFWASRNSQWRRNIRRCEKKLAEQGKVTHLRYRPQGTAYGDDDLRWDLYEKCEQVAGNSWQATSTTGTTLTHQSVRPFLRDVHVAAVRSGALDLNLLSIDDEPVAFAYNYRYLGYVFGVRMGFDAQAGKNGAGSVLLAKAIDGSFHNDDHTYDLGPGYPEGKRHWFTSMAPVHRYTYYSPKVARAQLMRLKQWTRSAILRRREKPQLTDKA